MALDTRPVRSAHDPERRNAVRRPSAPRETERDRGRPTRSLIVALLLACATLMVVDKTGGEDSPVDAVRGVVGDVIGPIEAVTDRVVGPVAGIPGALRSNGDLRGDIDELEAENAALRSQLAKAGYDDARLEELQGLRKVAGDLGYALVPTRVIALGSAQTSATITLDAGSDAGLAPDMTVVAADGLVGRITSVTSRTATVLLVIDAGSSVGGRIGDNAELGFVRGRGRLGTDERLEMELADRNLVPKVGQQVLTWGSEGGSPYVAGVPIGKVTRVYESLRETTYRSVIEPAVDFTSLDLVGVVVPSGTGGRVIEADGSLR